MNKKKPTKSQKLSEFNRRKKIGLVFWSAFNILSLNFLAMTIFDVPVLKGIRIASFALCFLTGLNSFLIVLGATPQPERRK